ncbi:MAG: peptide-methionine (R)-S-oxide reductase MsrB [Dokdonella sp.]
MSRDEPSAMCPRRSRRRFLIDSAALAIGGFAAMRSFARNDARAAHQFEIHFDGGQRKQRLTPAQYAVLRAQGTERPYSSALNSKKRARTFTCAGCDNALFASGPKFESATGWPGFFRPLGGAVDEQSDRTLGMLRTAVDCRRCGGHLGQVFDDGPAPTGLRYCMNGRAMQFTATT